MECILQKPWIQYLKPVKSKEEGNKGGGSMNGLSIVDVEKQKYTYEEMCEDLQALSKAYPGKLTVNKLIISC